MEERKVDEKNNLSEENVKTNNNTMSLPAYLGYSILFFIPVILTFICLIFYKYDTNLIYDYTDKINMDCFYIIIAIAIINIIMTSIFSFKGNNVSRKNFAKSFFIFAFLTLIVEVCCIGKFMTLNDYEEEVKDYVLNNIKDNENSFLTYKIEHISKSILEKILDELSKNPEEYSFLNYDIEDMRKKIEDDEIYMEGYKKQNYTIKIGSGKEDRLHIYGDNN